MPAFDDQSASLPNARAARDGSTGRMEPPDDATVISGPIAAVTGKRSSAEIGQRLQGTMLGPYRLDSFIGGGGMGAVFRALDTTLDRIVAVKVLAGGQADDEEMLRRFRNEAQSAARLDHENIGRVFAVGSEGGWHFIVFEFIEGRNLRDLVRDEGPFDLGRTVDVAVQVADALEHASQRDVVHRDIKPSNIVITPGGKARIVDMGLARLQAFDGDGDLTASGVTLGTFDYISPEQARDARVADVRSDLYSLGCTMFFMLAGRPPFAEGSMVQKLLQHQQEPPPAIEALRPDVPRAFGAIIGRLMKKDPADRYQRPADLVADLLAFADAHGHVIAVQRTATSAVVPSVPEAPAARLPWVVPLLGLVATIGALWYQAASARTRSAAAPAPSPTRAETGQGPLTPTVSRVGRSQAAGAAVGPAALSTAFTAAIERSGDGDVVELAFDGAIDVPAISLAGRRLTVRSAAGARPILRFVALSESRDGLAVACDVGTGHLIVEGVALRMEADAPTGRRSALFRLTAGRLVCDDVLLVMPDDDRAATDMAPAFVAVQAEGTAGERRNELSLGRTRACGDAVFLGMADGSDCHVQLSWSGGGLISKRPLIVAEGGLEASDEAGIEATLADAVFACRDGLVALRDSLSWPRIPRLDVVAKNCDFLLAGGPLVGQSGVGEPVDYDAVFSWRDEGSRYGGGEVMRRVEGAAERIDVYFRDQPVALRHAETAAEWPNAAEWEAAWASGAD